MNEIIFTSLTYFQDADGDNEERGIKIFSKDYSWEMCKKEISEAVKLYTKNM